METLKIYKKPRLRNPYIICAWPGMGEVAFKAVTYLIDKLKAEAFAEILPQEFFYLTGSIIKNGILGIPELPYSKFYYWKNKTGKNDLIIFLSSAQPDLIKAEEYTKKIVHTAKIFKAKMAFCFAAMPQPIDHTQKPNVCFSATSKGLNDYLKRFELDVLSVGQISGMNGLFLGLAKKEGLEGVCLLGEIPLYTIQIENPKASYSVLEVLCRVLDIKIDLSGLIEQSEMMEKEINKLADYLKIEVSAGALGPIGEEDIEKIKKSLNQLTKLPVSVKEKIEKLFTDALRDISKANDLKLELDKWNVYKEYEDRFLDLFKKAEDKNN